MNRCRNIFHLLMCASLLVSLIAFTVRVTYAAVSPTVTTFSTITAGVSTPVRLASDQLGALYVSDVRKGGIVKYDASGAYVRTIATTKKALGLASTASGDILVSQGASVAVYSSTGTKLREFGTFGNAAGIAVSSSGRIFVVDSKNNNVQVFNPDYTEFTLGTSNSFGSVGKAVGQFRQPTGITYEKLSDQLAVVDTLNGRIQFFSTEGVYKKTLGSFGSGPLKFTAPQAVSFEYSSDKKSLERIYVVDSFQSTVQAINGADGGFLRYIGSYGVTSGKLVTPSDILFDSSSRLIVANGNGALSLYGISSAPTGGPPLTVDSNPPTATVVGALPLFGTTSADATMAVSVNDVPVVVSKSGANWKTTVVLVAGKNKIDIAASTGSGTTSASYTVFASAVSANAVALSVSPAPPGLTSMSQLKLSGTVTSGATVTVNGAAATVNGTTWSAGVTLVKGNNSLVIAASKAGMDDSSLSYSIAFDNTRPQLASALPTSGNVFHSPMQTISGTVTASSATNIVITRNGVSQTVPVSDGIFSVPLLLAKGSNAISLVAVDSYGNTSAPVISSTVTYDPQAIRITIDSPAGALSSTPIYNLRGKVPSAGCTVMVNGIPATMNGTAWSAPVNLELGINNVEVTATLLTGDATATGTASTSILYDPSLPALAITSPLKDVGVATQAYILSGTAKLGAAVTATVNGTPVTVNVTNTGAFSLSVSGFSTPLSRYVVIVTVTDTVTGAMSSSTRTLVYDPVPPNIGLATTAETPNSGSSAPLTKFSASSGVIVARDKNGPVGTIVIDSNGVATLDLTGAVYDPATLDVHSLSDTGLSSRDGNVKGSGQVEVADALMLLQVVVGKAPPLTPLQMLRADVGPVVEGEPTVDSKITMSDVIVVLEKVIGLSSW